MTLTVALAVVAAVVLAAVIIHGEWSARRAGPRRASNAGAAAGPRVEPSFDERAAPSSPAPSAADPADRLPALPIKRSARVDALIDAIAPLTLETPLSGEFVLAHLPLSRRAGSKPFCIEGLNAHSGEWESPVAGQRYGQLQAGLQLANRSGALNEIEYSEFVQKVQAFADAVGAMADFPDMLEAVARGRELDAFASPHDAQLTLQLNANSAAWSAGYIQQSAARHGFVAGAVPGRMVLPSSEEGELPVLQLNFDAQAALADDPNATSLRSLTISLDVAQTPEAAEPFASWQQAARALADDMDGTLVDDDGRPVTLHAFDAIGKEIAVLYRALEARDLAAGSVAARRLFS